MKSRKIDDDQQPSYNATQITDLFLKQFTRFLPQYLFWKDSRSVIQAATCVTLPWWGYLLR